MRRDTFASAQDREACRAMIRHGSKSFFAASKLLPADVRDGAFALYAFCRMSDDVVDVEGGRAGAIARLNQRLDDAYAGAPGPSPVDRALADTVRAHAIPKTLLAALLEGLSWDVDQRRYETIEALTAYAARVAGAVGAMMTALMGARSPALAARACDLGVAMQFTNIARDVGEDAQAGRLYLPLTWMREEGLDPDAFLAAPAPSPALTRVVRRLLDHADTIYRRADAGVARLPAPCRPAIGAARLIYAEIGAEVRRAGYDSVRRRARVSAARKLALAALACGRAFAPLADAQLLAAAPLAQTKFLVDAVARPEARALRAGGSPLTWIDDNWGWVWDLFQRMGQRERPARRG